MLGALGVQTAPALPTFLMTLIHSKVPLLLPSIFLPPELHLASAEHISTDDRIDTFQSYHTHLHSFLRAVNALVKQGVLLFVGLFVFQPLQKQKLSTAM